MPTPSKDPEALREKRCTRCDEVKPFSAFASHKGNTNGIQSQCKPCQATSRRERYAANPELAALKVFRQRLARYNVTAQWYAAKVVEQGDTCAICAQPPRGSWNIDHDHRCCEGDRSCGRCVRGLVHGDCNRAIGLLRDDPNVLMSAAAYLIQHEGVFSALALA